MPHLYKWVRINTKYSFWIINKCNQRFSQLLYSFCLLPSTILLLLDSKTQMSCTWGITNQACHPTVISCLYKSLYAIFYSMPTFLFGILITQYKKPSYRWGTARRGRASWNLVKFCTNVDDLYLKSSETRLLPIRL